MEINRQKAPSVSFFDEDSVYSFLKNLGLGKTNLGVYHGHWTGNGPVSIQYFLICNKSAFIMF